MTGKSGENEGDLVSRLEINEIWTLCGEPVDPAGGLVGMQTRRVFSLFEARSFDGWSQLIEANFLFCSNVKTTNHEGLIFPPQMAFFPCRLHMA